MIAGCPPLDDPHTFEQLNRIDHAFVRLARSAPIGLRLISTCMHALSRFIPRVLLTTSVRAQPKAEVNEVREQGGWLPMIIGEGTENSRGVVDEYLAIVAPWGFRPEDVQTPVHVYQGTADALVPEEWGRNLAERLPGASLTVYPDEGHFIALTRREDVLKWLAGTDGSANTAGA